MSVCLSRDRLSIAHARCNARPSAAGVNDLVAHTANYNTHRIARNYSRANLLIEISIHSNLMYP